ncbi:MAG: TonB-dependent receptor plug [Bacteroidetes bacterium]|nr:MAG: TonB-dependent receptor plug [Bacteroidota bacterium]
MPRFAWFLFFSFLPPLLGAQQNFTISGTVLDSTNGESVIGGVVYVKGTSKGVQTNVYGFYSLTLAEGSYDIIVNYVTYRSRTLHVDLKSNVTLNIRLAPEGTAIDEVVITADKDKEKEQLRSTQMSAINIPIDQIKHIPTIGGETDVIKVMQLMPGVKRGGEGQNTMLVRGGSGDDNLILLDEAVVYNVSHLFGFFSVFNNDALKDVTLIKGGFPSQYGGRLSSVMDIRMKDGDMQKYHVDGGIGLLSSHLTVQGPIKKDTCSFILSGRRSYIDQLFRLVYKEDLLPYYFYDATLKVNYILSDKNRLFLSTYYGDDVLRPPKSDSALFDGGFRLGNFTTTLRWNHVYNSKLFSNLSFIHTRFRYDVEASVPGNSFLAKSRIADYGVKLDYSYYKNPENLVRYGGLVTLHGFRPNVVNTAGVISDVIRSREGALKSNVEAGLYIQHEWEIHPLLKLGYGFRESFLIDSDTFYTSPEPRAALTYNFHEKQSLKLSYARMTQYVHLVSSSAVALPTDLWYPVTKNVKPLYSDQVAAGYNYNFEKLKTLASFEVYYKHMKNLIEYREGAVLLLNDNYENELVSGNGDSYGCELFAQRSSGRFTGWIGYTLSWTTRKFDALNGGKRYYAKFDRRHDVSVVGAYEITKRFLISAVWVYSTGQRFTPVIGYYLMPNSSLTDVDILPIYGDRNSTELPPAHRLDLSLVLKSREKEKRKWMKWESEWSAGAYNVYNRAQPYRIEVVDNGQGGLKYVAKGLFGMIPFIAYNFRF